MVQFFVSQPVAPVNTDDFQETTRARALIKHYTRMTNLRFVYEATRITNDYVRIWDICYKFVTQCK